MPTNSGSLKNLIKITGSLRIKCGDFYFDLELTPENLVANFPSLGMLLRAKTKGDEFTKLIADIPTLPSLPIAPASSSSSKPTKTLPKEKILFVAVNSRPVGKLSLNGTNINFTPTPLRFFTKLK